jgi:hypothetical protein
MTGKPTEHTPFCVIVMSCERHRETKHPGRTKDCSICLQWNSRITRPKPTTPE